MVENINELDVLAHKYGTDKRTNDLGERTYHGYTLIYHDLFKNYRENYTSILEIGVREGYSHLMWHDYFPNAMIYGIDNCSEITYEQMSKIENDRIKIFVGEQDDETFLKSSLKNIEFNVILDDGSHKSWHQQRSFKYLFPQLKSGGYYIFEDLGVCAERSFREFDDIRSSTVGWLGTIIHNQHFSYYISDYEFDKIKRDIRRIIAVDQLGIIVKA